MALVACVPCGLPQGERDDERKQGLNRRRQPLDQAEVTAAVPGRDQEPARQPGEDHGHRRAAADTQDPRSPRRAPGDKYRPDRCRDHAAHRQSEVARRRARGRFRSGGDAESRKTSQDQQDARRHADASQACAGRDLTAAHQQQGRGHHPPVGSRLTSQHAHRLPHRAIRGRLNAPATSHPRPAQQAPARLCPPPSQALAGQPAEAPGDRQAMVQHWPTPGQGVRDLVLIGCTRGLDAQAESWLLHQPRRLGLPEGGARDP